MCLEVLPLHFRMRVWGIDFRCVEAASDVGGHNALDSMGS